MTALSLLSDAQLLTEASLAADLVRHNAGNQDHTARVAAEELFDELLVELSRRERLAE